MEEGGERGQGGGGAGAGDPLQGKAGGQVGLRGQARPARGQAGGNIKEKEIEKDFFSNSINTTTTKIKKKNIKESKYIRLN